MPTNLLNDDGTASMATMIMSSHHAFRRDVACFARAVAAIAAGDGARAEAVRDEWKRFRDALHGHHMIEDTNMFPAMRAEHPELAASIDTLDTHHRAIDPVLERGDRAFAALPPGAAGAARVIDELAALLDEHLELEERTVTPHLRAAKQFPAPPDDAMLAMYADGFAWSTTGLAAPVIDQIYAMLPPALVACIPAARDAFDERCRTVWGRALTGASRTSVP